MLSASEGHPRHTVARLLLGALAKTCGVVTRAYHVALAPADGLAGDGGRASGELSVHRRLGGVEARNRARHEVLRAPAVERVVAAKRRRIRRDLRARHGIELPRGGDGRQVGQAISEKAISRGVARKVTQATHLVDLSWLLRNLVPVSGYRARFHAVRVACGVRVRDPVARQHLKELEGAFAADFFIKVHVVMRAAPMA